MDLAQRTLPARELLGPDGPFAKLLPGYQPRTEQQDLAEAVAEALDGGRDLVAEAGTGVGKSFAYLVPALLHGGKVIISTGTRHLQDQLYFKDLPVVRRALQLDVDVALLKGRSNYLCRHRLHNALEPGQVRAPEMRQQVARVREWSVVTRRGDISEMPGLPEESPVWPLVTSTADNCLGSECPQFAECHVVEARRRAQEADVVIVNHHLLLADMALKEEGFGEILPSAEGFVIDEAHQLPEVAGRFFSRSVSRRMLDELTRDVVAEQLQEAPDMPRLRDLAQRVEQGVHALRLVMDGLPQRAAWSGLRRKQELVRGLEDLRQRLLDLQALLSEAAVRGKGLEHCSQRCAALHERLQDFDRQPEGWVQWLEYGGRGFTLSSTPLDIASTFERFRQSLPAPWVFTSATLAVGEDFGYFARRMGLEETARLRLDSPYDFARQGLLYVPRGLPDPGESRYTEAMLEQVLPVIEACGGRTFLLFTSHRALQIAAHWLQGKLDYPLLAQGQASKRELLDSFRRAGNAVLLGTQSFWEGVDVRGEALSCVIIDKLPFASPGDPVVQARIDALKAAGENAFAAFQIPQAVLTLKQGVGRLIRDSEDRGVLVLCDPRLRSRSYGRRFLGSLPQLMPVASVAEIEAFFASRPEVVQASD